MTPLAIRSVALIATAAAALALSACASGQPIETYAAATQRLAEECRERGGILQPVSATTGRAETDNVCRIPGGASRLTRSD
jgi:putative hemolysin